MPESLGVLDTLVMPFLVQSGLGRFGPCWFGSKRDEGNSRRGFERERDGSIQRRWPTAAQVLRPDEVIASPPLLQPSPGLRALNHGKTRFSVHGQGLTTRPWPRSPRGWTVLEWSHLK